VIAVEAGGHVALGPSSIAVPSLDTATLWLAFTVLVLPQAPLSFANSCLATADAARVYFGAEAARVRPGRLATTLGAANIVAGAIGGMPVCRARGRTSRVVAPARHPYRRRASPDGIARRFAARGEEKRSAGKRARSCWPLAAGGIV
jgi:hypothetical protein